VDVATGRVFTHVAERGSPALTEFPWERFYGTATAGEAGPLGWGWAHSLTQRLELGPEDLTYVDAEGRRVLFPRLDLGESVQHLDEQITLAQGNEGEYVLERPEGVTLFFEEDPDHGVARLQAVFDDAGQFLVLEYEALLRRITDSLGNVYRVDSEDGLHWSSLTREATQNNIVEEEPEHCLARFQYDRAGHLSAAADALGEWWRYGYDHAHRLVQETDRSGFSFFFEYDGKGRCLRTRGQDGVYDLSFSYAEGQTTQRDAHGNVTAYEYSDLGLVTRVTDAGGHSEEFSYAGALQTARTDALGRTTAYAYDPEGRVTERTAPSGATDRMAYDAGGLASLSEPEGEPLTRTVTPEGQILVSTASAPLLKLEADPEDGSVVVTDGAFERSRLHFDETGRLAAAVSPLGRTLEASYDSFGSVSALRDTAGRTVRFEYDAEGRLSAVDRENGSGFRFGYDPEGNLEYFVDGNEGVTRFGTGGFHQLQSLTAPDGRAVRFEYDDANHLHRLLDARQSSWQMDYDRSGRLERLLHPEGGSETFSYDPAGQVQRHTARSGAGKEYDYDADGSLTQIRCDDGNQLAFAYDKNGRVTSASGPSSDVQFEYDGLGRLARETQNGQSVTYTYDAAGRLSGIETPASDQLAYRYDADGMLTEATNWNGGRHSVVYAADGTLQSLHAPNGVSSRFEYSPLGLPTLVHLERAGEAAPLAQIRPRFDGNDALAEALDSALGRARFEYDPAGRLVRASGETPETFEYDPAGNLTACGKQQFQYNAGNERLSSPEYACRHDADGNLVEEDTPEGTRRYTYNALGLLVSAEMPGGVRAEYAYDPFGRRYRKRVHQAGRGGRWTETRFVWAGDQLLSETTADDAGAVLETRDFLFLPGSFTPLAQRVNGAAYCCHTDFRGAPTRLTDEQGQVAWAAAYCAYGTAHPRKERLRQPLRLPGQYHDPETGLHQNRWRSFDPSTGRYLSPDPLGLAGGMNLYAYAEQDPINGQDPLGQLFSVGDLTGHLLPPQAMQAARQLRQTVSQNVLNHLGPLQSLLPPANPRPPDPAMSLVHPQHHLPPLPAQAPTHQAPAHHAPAPAKAAASCAPAPHSAPAHHPHHAPVPLPPQPKTPYMIFTTCDTAEGLKTGLRRTNDFLQGFQDQIVDTFNPVSIYKGLHQFGQDEADIYIPSADGTTKDGDAYARKMGHGIVESFNPFDKTSAKEAGRSTGNIATVIVPGAAELDALKGLRMAVRGTEAEAAAARAGALRAAGTPEEASAQATLRAAEAKAAAAREAYEAKLPGAGVRKIAAKAKAAGAKAKERRAGGAEPPVRTPEQVAAAEQKFNSQKQGALEEARHNQLNQRQPALAGTRPHSAEVARPSEAPRSNSTAAIGQSHVMKAEGEGSSTTRPTLKENIRKAIPPGSRRLSNPTVASTKVPYNKFDLSRKIVAYRKANNLMDSEGNLAVIEYTHNGVKSWEIGESEFNGPHSEESAWGKLYGKGIRPEEVERVYTEREPCTLPAHACGRWMNSIFPNTKVFHSFDYGQTAASRAAGNEALKQALQSVKEGK